MFYPPNKDNKPIGNFSNQTNIKNCTISVKLTFLGALHILIIREHSSGSVVFYMALYYAQYKNTTFQWRSCLVIN